MIIWSRSWRWSWRWWYHDIPGRDRAKSPHWQSVRWTRDWRIRLLCLTTETPLQRLYKVPSLQYKYKYNYKYKIRNTVVVSHCTGETSLQRIYQVPSVQWKRILQSYILSSRWYFAHASCNQCHSYFLLGIIHFNDGMCEQKCYHVRYRPEHWLWTCRGGLCSFGRNMKIYAYFPLTGVFLSRFPSWSSSLSYKTGRLPLSDYQLNETCLKCSHSQVGLHCCHFLCRKHFQGGGFCWKLSSVAKLLLNQNHKKMVWWRWRSYWILSCSE